MTLKTKAKIALLTGILLGSAGCEVQATLSDDDSDHMPLAEYMDLRRTIKTQVRDLLENARNTPSEDTCHADPSKEEFKEDFGEVLKNALEAGGLKKLELSVLFEENLEPDTAEAKAEQNSHLYELSIQNSGMDDFTTVVLVCPKFLKLKEQYKGPASDLNFRIKWKSKMYGWKVISYTLPKERLNSVQPLAIDETELEAMINAIRYANLYSNGRQVTLTAEEYKYYLPIMVAKTIQEALARVREMGIQGLIDLHQTLIRPVKSRKTSIGPKSRGGRCYVYRGVVIEEEEEDLDY